MKSLFRRDVSAVLENADAARDRQDWRAAQVGYEAYLAKEPKNSPIWVQLGHARKEQGDLPGAEEAYRKAIGLKSDVADFHLQLGHVLKLMGKIGAAAKSYRKSLDLDPDSASAEIELRNLGVKIPDNQGVVTAAVRDVIDLSDVIFYLRHHSTVSGIQRVQLGIARALIERDRKSREILFVTAGSSRGDYVTVEARIVAELAFGLAAGSFDAVELQAILRRATSEGRLYRPRRGDTVLMLGAFWVMENVVENIIHLKKFGVKIGIMIHDLIPITHPEFCETDLTASFTLYMNSVFDVVDFILCISEHTRSAVKQQLVARNIAAPTYVLKNAHLSWEVGAYNRDLVSEGVLSETAEDFILFVSTIEIRKNHIILFKVWKKLREEFGNSTPKLLLVGRPGWRVQDLMAQLKSTNYLNGNIKILHDLSDVELQHLYLNCRFSVFPSFEEGWGLPVGEGLYFGKPVAASSASSIPEVGGQFCDYFDPDDLEEAYTTIRKLIVDKNHYEKRLKNIQANFTPRTWDNVAEELDEILIGTDEMKISLNVSGRKKFLLPGVIHRIGHQDKRVEYSFSGIAQVVPFIFDRSWYPVENFGRWLAGGSGSIEFNVEKSESTYDLYISLSTTPWNDDLALIIVVNGVEYAVPSSQLGATQRLSVQTQGSDGKIKIQFKVAGEIRVGSDPRLDLSVGVSELGFADVESLSDQIKILKELMITSNQLVRLVGTGG